MLAAVKNVAKKSRAYVSAPGTGFSTSTPVFALSLMAKAGGLFPLLLWVAFSVIRGAAPVAMVILASR